ncbi:MAG: hypothetical protein ACTSRO_12715, partial [Candidatus Heimdallarchaeaceae archaeon]
LVSWSGEETGANKTLQRSPPNQDTDDCDSDFIIADPTPGTVAEITPEFNKILVLPVLLVIGLAALYVKKRK